MHDTGVIVWHLHGIDDTGGVLNEVDPHSMMYVLVVDFDIAVSVWSWLLMVETNSMTELMDDDSFLWGVIKWMWDGTDQDVKAEYMSFSTWPPWHLAFVVQFH